LLNIRRLITVGAVCALAASGAAAAGATASALAIAAPWPSQVTRPAAASCPRGETLIAPTGGRTDSLGITHITYRADLGMVANIPPKGLTASRVTSAVLADLGIRVSRSTSSRSRRLVQQVISLGKDRVAPEFCWSRPDPAEARFQGDPDPKNTRVYGNWAGYGVTEAEHGGSINGVNGSWTVPQQHTLSLTPSAESTWVGVGGGLGEGSTTEGLIQAGTEMQTGSGYRTFYEAIGSSGCTIHTHFCGQYSSVNAVRPGDSVSATVWWDTSTSASFLVATSSGGGTWDVTTGVNIPYDHTSAEWVDEWPPSYAFYDSPGTVHFSDQSLGSSFAGQGSYTSPFAGSYEAVIMAPPNSGTSCSDANVISYPADPANTSAGGSSDIFTCKINQIDYP
jgi:hypothetical protein